VLRFGSSNRKPIALDTALAQIARLPTELGRKFRREGDYGVSAKFVNF
jgi:hypothetical protein